MPIESLDNLKCWFMFEKKSVGLQFLAFQFSYESIKS